LDDRAAATYIHRQIHPGDTIVYTSMSRASIEYYLRRFGWDRELRHISFPAEFAGHLGWLDSRRDYSLEPTIRAEAKQLMERLRQLPPESNIFLLCGNNPDPDQLAFDPQGGKMADMLVAEFERSFHLLSKQSFAGSFFSEVRKYSRQH
jgi:hypothetical protein